ncbi:MAG: alpha/beta fold hydrolase [Gemmatimonadetes bacterium]|nr:alpha/beta fold hydrolase [Gemmatimonadota bacterium]
MSGIGRTATLVLVVGAAALAGATAGERASWPPDWLPPAMRAWVASDGEPSRPSGPVPVVLLPGWFNRGEDMEPLRARFLESGWDSASVVALDFEDPVGSNRTHARELARAVLDLQERTGAPRVDVVAHSMGGLALRYYLWNGGAAAVRRVVFMATPHRGTVTSFLAWGEGAAEMRPGSAFLVGITRAPLLPPAVEALTVRTPLDLHVLPPESATLPGIPDVEVCCPTHEGMLDDDETFQAVRGFLGEG